MPKFWLDLQTLQPNHFMTNIIYEFFKLPFYDLFYWFTCRSTQRWPLSYFLVSKECCDLSWKRKTSLYNKQDNHKNEDNMREKNYEIIP